MLHCGGKLFPVVNFLVLRLTEKGVYGSCATSVSLNV